jgi:hypothetical protein
MPREEARAARQQRRIEPIIGGFGEWLAAQSIQGGHHQRVDASSFTHHFRDLTPQT